jgi:hypothetical protein
MPETDPTIRDAFKAAWARVGEDKPRPKPHRPSVDDYGDRMDERLVGNRVAPAPPLVDPQSEPAKPLKRR